MSITGDNLRYNNLQKMKKFVTYIPLAILFIVAITLSFAQQNQTTSTSDMEVEALKKQISTLQNQLQTVKNEKIELVAKLLDAQAKLADANARLINTDLGKLERELRGSNEKWLIGWIVFFLTALAVVGTPLWLLLKSGVNRIITNLKSNADHLIADSVEKSLNGFKASLAQVDTLKNELKEAMSQVNILADQVRILKKEQAISVLSGLINLYDPKEQNDYEETSPIQSETLLDVFVDKTRNLELRYKAGEVLSAREIPQFVSPLLEFLNSVINSEFDWKDILHTEFRLLDFVKFLGYIHTQEVYKGLTGFLDRLLSTEDVELKELLLTQTVFSLARVSAELNEQHPLSTLITVVPDLKILQDTPELLSDLVEYFDRFNEPEGIKEIFTHHAAGKMSELEDKCLELLEKHDPNFVRDWKAQKANANTESDDN